MTWQGIALIVYSVLMPVVALALVKRFKWAQFLGPVLISCAFGIFVANQPFITWSEEVAKSLAKTSEIISSAAIPLAIPLLLFQSDMSNLRAQGKTVILSFVLAVLSVFGGVLAMKFWYGPELPDPSFVSGMVMSVYIGGTPNLVAVQRALEASDQTFGLVYAATTFVSTFYLVFLLTAAKPLLRKLFPEHPFPEPLHIAEVDEEQKERLSWGDRFKFGGMSLGASVVCVLIAAGVTIALTGKPGSLGVILGITTLSVAGSFWKKLREIPTHEPIGTFLILIFCVAAGTMMDVGKLVATGSVVLSFTAWSVVVFLIMHYVLHRLFKVDLDTTITMSVATMFGPPFVPAVVQALDNRSVLLPGMTMGFLGYAVGTYLGIAVGLWL